MARSMGSSLEHFEVVGDVLGELEGEVDGDVLGAVADAVAKAVTKHSARHGGGGHGGHPMSLQKSAWRAGQLAPGVQAPQETMIPLPLIPQQNGGTFSATVTNITFQGQLQKPFRAERLFAKVIRVGASAVGSVSAQFFVGTDLQHAEIFGVDIELLGAPTSFGSRMTLLQAPPGVLIRALASIAPVPTGTDTATASMFFQGRCIQ